MRRRNMFILLLCIVLAVVFSGCGAQEEQPVPETTQATAAATVQTEPAEQTQPAPAEDTNVIRVETPLGDLFYQEQWREFMKVEQLQEDAVLRVSFRAEINGQKYPLFDILIGVAQEEAMAELTDDAGAKHPVGVDFFPLGDYPELTEDEFNRLQAMQEDINFVVENIR